MNPEGEQTEGGPEMESSPEGELQMPQETEMLIELVKDSEAKSAVEAYRDATLGYLTWLGKNPDATEDEINEQKRPVHESLDALNAHKEKPGVGDAMLGVLFGEMKIQGERRSQ